jgi:hypothetical protein
MRRHAELILVLGLILSALVMTACERKTINEIRADPGRYANREVAVVGTVVRSFSVLGRGAYEVDDGTGRLWVVSERGVPRQGAHVAVRGTIRDAFDLGAFIRLPEPVSAGMVLIENSHKARNTD